MSPAECKDFSPKLFSALSLLQFHCEVILSTLTNILLWVKSLLTNRLSTVPTLPRQIRPKQELGKQISGKHQSLKPADKSHLSYFPLWKREEMFGLGRCKFAGLWFDQAIWLKGSKRQKRGWWQWQFWELENQQRKLRGTKNPSKHRAHGCILFALYHIPCHSMEDKWEARWCLIEINITLMGSVLVLCDSSRCSFNVGRKLMPICCLCIMSYGKCHSSEMLPFDFYILRLNSCTCTEIQTHPCNLYIAQFFNC